MPALLEGYRAALLKEPEQRRAWLEGLTTQEGANLFAELHNLKRTSAVEQKIFDYVEALNWKNYHEKMHKVARASGITLPE